VPSVNRKEEKKKIYTYVNERREKKREESEKKACPWLGLLANLIKKQKRCIEAENKNVHVQKPKCKGGARGGR